jgi:CRISPR/Cas system-associated endonuclease Cas1
MKKTLILKDKTIQIKIHDQYIEFVSENKEFISAYKYISEIYMSKFIDISLTDALCIAKHVPLFFIDHNGYIIAKVTTDV